MQSNNFSCNKPLIHDHDQQGKMEAYILFIDLKSAIIVDFFFILCAKYYETVCTLNKTIYVIR